MQQQTRRNGLLWVPAGMTFVTALLALGQVTGFGATYTVEAPAPGETIKVDEAEDCVFVTWVQTCKNRGYWKVVCKGCDKESTEGTATEGSQGGMLEVTCETQDDGSYIDNLTYNYHHFAADYRVGQGSAGCGSCAAGVSSGAGLSELLIQRRHRFRNMTEYGSFGPGVYTNYDTKIFINEPNGAGNGVQMDVFDPRETWEIRMVDGMSGDALDGVFNDVQGKTVKQARLLDSTDTLTTNLNNAVAVELESHQGQVTRFEIIDLAGDAVSDEGLLGQWKFDGTSTTTAVDSSGAGNDGTIQGATRITTSTAPVPGGAGGAMSFDGINDYIDLGDPDALDVTDTTTITAWIKTDNTTGTRNIFAQSHDGGPVKGGVFLRVRDGNYQAGSWDGVGHFASVPIPAADAAGGGQWVHLAGVYDGATWRIYRNGFLVQAEQDETGGVPNVGSMAIGARGSGTNYFFDGEIDEVRLYDRNLLEGDIAQLAQQRVLAGRLVSITDRNGYSTDVTYKSFTPTQIDESPERQWQIDTVTDPYSRVATFNYKSTQVAGQWVVESIDLPNGEDVDYLYEDGLHLTKVQHADGTESTFSYTPDAGTQTLKVTFNDAAADGDHRNKTVYLTNQIVFFGGISVGQAQLYNQAALMIRMLTNGSNEVSYLNIPNPNHESLNESLIYTGTGRLRRVHAGWENQYYEDGWTFGDPTLGYDAVSGTLEPRFSGMRGLGFTAGAHYKRGDWPKKKDENGRTQSYTYDSDTFIKSKTFPDSTSEEYDYNGFKQVTSYVDRLGRETQQSYDANGNLTARRVGILNGVNQPEYAEYTKSYYDGSEGPAVAGITGAATVQPVSLLKSETDANGNTTHFVYDDDNFLIAQIQPADRVGDDRAITLFSYDTAGRLQTTTDPLGRVTTFAYDSRNRQKTVTYEDGSTQVMFYANELTGGAGSLANLVVATKDRNNNYTQYRYDGHGRRVTTIRGITAQADALDQSFVPDTTYHDVEECVYLEGTNLKTSCTRNGEKTEYVYDYRQRQIATIVYPREQGTFPFATNLADPDGAGPFAAGDDPGTLITLKRYHLNFLFASLDPYGRATFYQPRSSDTQNIRIVKETVPGGSGIDFETGLFNETGALTRDLSYEDAATLAATDLGGAGYLITDYVKDAEGQTISTVDPRNVQHDTEFDSRGRSVESVTAVGTTVEAKTETIYDAQSNVIEQLSPRYFDNTDTLGYLKAYTTMTYTGRNLLASRTVAAGDSTYDTFVTSSGTTGKGAQATEIHYYYLDGRKEKTVDFNGNDPQFTAADHTWLTIWRQCCERLRAQIDSEGHGRAQGTDFNGNVTHTAAVESLIDDVIVNANGSRTIEDSDFGGPGIWDAPDDRTLSETTTRFDSKNRPVASTVWLEPLGLVDPNDVPILSPGSGTIQGGTNAATAASGLGAGDGLTTLYYYSEDLLVLVGVTAGVEGAPNRGSNDNDVLCHQYGPDIDLSPLLLELANDDISVLDPGNTSASARATINPEGEISVSIMDGVGRPVIQAMLDPTTNDPITWSTVSHDRLSDATDTDYGITLETMSISALDNLNRSRRDAAGRTIEAQDAENNIIWFVYDNNGQPVRTRDANNVGHDCDYDPRNRRIACIDTQGDETETTYNAASQVLATTDAKNVSNAANTVFDARGRVLGATTRLDVADTNSASYDPNSNTLTQTDAEGGVTTYEYNPRNLRIAQEWPGHNTSSVVGDSDYDRAEMAYDALGRPQVKTDQQGDTVVHLYDLAGRLEQRDYRTLANSGDSDSDGIPDGTIADSDTFTYDDNSRPLTAVKGRYSNTVAFAYDNIGRPESESLTTNGQTYTVDYDAYDDDSRLTTIGYPDGSTVTRTFTPRNQVEDVNYTPSGGSATTIATSTYDAGMRETLRELGNGLETSFAYRGNPGIGNEGDNLFESITVETAPSQADRPGLSFAYDYDANKNLTAEDTGGVMDDYGFDLTHDAKDRMIGWTRDDTGTALDSQDWTLSFEADWDDTTLTDGGSGTTQTRTHDAAHQLLTLDPDGTGGVPALPQTHDAKGNLTTNGSGLTVGYDFDNMINQVVVSSTSPQGQEGTHGYEYDAFGRRVAKSVDSNADGTPDATTVFNYAGQQVLVEYTGGTAASTPERKFIYGNFIDEPLVLIDATGAGEDLYYYHRNRQYSIIGLTDDTGVVIERYAYTAYGTTTVLDANATADADNLSDMGNSYTYTGRRLDDETGLHYFRARYHDSVLGRFLERDPLGYPDGMNTYAAYYVMQGGMDPMGTATLGGDDTSLITNPPSPRQIRNSLNGSAYDGWMSSGDLDTLANKIRNGGDFGENQIKFTVNDILGFRNTALECKCAYKVEGFVATKNINVVAQGTATITATSGSSNTNTESSTTSWNFTLEGSWQNTQSGNAGVEGGGVSVEAGNETQTGVNGGASVGGSNTNTNTDTNTNGSSGQIKTVYKLKADLVYEGFAIAECWVRGSYRIPVKINLGQIEWQDDDKNGS